MNTLNDYTEAFNKNNKILFLGAKVNGKLLTKFKKRIKLIKQFAVYTNETFFLDLKKEYLINFLKNKSND